MLSYINWWIFSFSILTEGNLHHNHGHLKDLCLTETYHIFDIYVKLKHLKEADIKKKKKSTQSVFPPAVVLQWLSDYPTLFSLLTFLRVQAVNLNRRVFSIHQLKTPIHRLMKRSWAHTSGLRRCDKFINEHWAGTWARGRHESLRRHHNRCQNVDGQKTFDSAVVLNFNRICSFHYLFTMIDAVLVIYSL